MPQKEENLDGSRDRSHAEHLLSDFSLKVTGARVGETLKGNHKGSRGSIIKLYGPEGTYLSPYTKSLNTLRYFPDLWNMYLGRLGSLEFFRKMSNKEREQWIEEHEEDKDVDLAEVDGMEMELIQLGEGKFTEFPSDKIEIFTSGIHSIMDVRNMYSGKVVSGARRHTLIFLRVFWTVMIAVKPVKKYEGYSFDVETGEYLKKVRADESHTIFLFSSFTEEKKEIAIRLNKKGVQVTDEDAMIEIGKKVGSFSDEDYKHFRKATRTFTAGAYKSLLQKTIRFRAKYVTLKGVDVLASKVVVMTLVSLISNPGSFIPDIGKFVSGAESTSKRLAITMIEDGYVRKEWVNDILGMMISTYLFQKLKSWSPTKKMVKRWFQLGLETYESIQYGVYDGGIGCKKIPFVITDLDSLSESSKDKLSERLPWVWSSIFLDEVKSFSGDMGMVRYIAYNTSKYYKPQEIDDYIQPKRMPLEHCVDMHWLADIYYYIPYELVRQGAVKGITPLKPFNGLIFNAVSGINSRIRQTGKKKSYSKDFEKNECIQLVRRTQRLALTARQSKIRERTEISHTSGSGQKRGLRIEYTLDNSWVPGMVGPLTIPGRPVAIATMDPVDPSILVALQKPSRDSKSTRLTFEREEEVKRKASDELRQGVKLNACRGPIPGMNKYYGYVDNKDKVWLEKDDNWTLWEDFRHGEERFPYVKDLPLTLENALTHGGNGVSKNALKELKVLVEETSPAVLRRVMYYLTGYNLVIEPNRMSRDGGGTEYPVVPEDVGAYHFMLMVSLLFPSALRRLPGNVIRFEIPFGPLMWDVVRPEISSKLAPKKGDVRSWGKIKGDKRKPWKHQIDAVREMIERHERGRRGNLIWISIGQGKTRCSLDFINYLISKKELPSYVIFALPKEAIKSVGDEILNYGFKIEVLTPTKSVPKQHPFPDLIVKGEIPNKNVITLVKHDHLRLCIDGLSTLSGKFFFVMDEVHKALNNSLRTNASVQLASLATGVIAMTGTIVVDTNVDKLIPWLKQVVPFAVNEKNFWTAANSLIAKLVNTGIKVYMEPVIAKFSSKENKEYIQLVVPAVGGINPSSTAKDRNQAMKICYKACTRKMIEQTGKNLKKGGVMLVAKDNKHQQQLLEGCLSDIPKLKRKDIFVLEGGASINLKDETVEAGEVRDYKIVIVTIRQETGYNLSRLKSMVTCVYESNESSRTQLEGRINRRGQTAKELKYYVVQIGILAYIYQNHRNARTFAKILESLADEI